ncbi:PiggyBac transposable element-derived protein 3 [Trichinella murrelli]|uniref:PiggyBac transposable element-derived protein 3 n=1 Tax=Trichinella murrelli TaxID=144512 RepID=A0A0V0T8S8_9BILA|nr:PiggyBac transposable element-derived protein 3 [Trichinella murrelli]KRX34932.1 PiggyBac transposable element-derived protein 3 [Trichinella murrelli]
MSLSTRAVTAMVDVIQENSQTFRHTLYFDNFFTCYYLFVKLAKFNIAFDYRSDRKVHVVKWNDNAVVKIASNYMTHSPLCVRLCITGMGEADILDRLAVTHCLTIRAKKWYWSLFINTLNVATSLFYREKMSHPPGILLPFCPQHATAKSMCPPKAEAGFLSQCPEIRFDGVNHILCTGPKGRCEVCIWNTQNMQKMQCLSSRRVGQAVL